jgi:CBS domain-containing protein
MQAALLMTREVVTCTPETSLADAARLMREHGVGFLPVVGAHGRLKGVLTDRDALLASAKAGKRLAALRVEGAMKQPITSCGPEAELELVERLLARAGLHRLPVTDEEGRLVGVISIDDLACAAARRGDADLLRRVGLTLSAIVHKRSPSDDED